MKNCEPHGTKLRDIKQQIRILTLSKLHQYTPAYESWNYHHLKNVIKATNDAGHYGRSGIPTTLA